MGNREEKLHATTWREVFFSAGKSDEFSKFSRYTFSCFPSQLNPVEDRCPEMCRWCKNLHFEYIFVSQNKKWPSWRNVCCQQKKRKKEMRWKWNCFVFLLSSVVNLNESFAIKQITYTRSRLARSNGLLIRQIITKFVHQQLNFES